MKERENSIVRDYLLKSKIGQGGMGEVWLAMDRSLDREVAVKILSADLTNNSDIIARFRQEAKLQASLIHKNSWEVKQNFKYFPPTVKKDKL